MSNRMGMPHRSDITQDIGDSEKRMDLENDFMETAVADHEVVEGTIYAIALDITEEGAQSVETELRSAEDAARSEFNDHDRELERVQGENTDIETDLKTRETSGEGDLKQTETSRTRVEVRNVIDHMERVIDALREDVEFLRTEGERTKDTREESEREQAALQARFGTGGKS